MAPQQQARDFHQTVQVYYVPLAPPPLQHAFAFSTAGMPYTTTSQECMQHTMSRLWWQCQGCGYAGELCAAAPLPLQRASAISNAGIPYTPMSQECMQRTTSRLWQPCKGCGSVQVNCVQPPPCLRSGRRQSALPVSHTLQCVKNACDALRQACGDHAKAVALRR